jgi:putative hydrolase of the HAD superfamily
MTSSSLGNPPAIIFDGDDTLWATQELYDEAKERFFALLEKLGHNRESTGAKFTEIDVANVRRFGLSRARFPTSMQETYEFFCRATGAHSDAGVAARAVALGNSVFDMPPRAHPDVIGTLQRLRGQAYRLLLFTAGDEDVQLRRIEQTSLRPYFDAVRITPLKTPEAWTELVRSEGLCVARTWSVGNSLRSDINPALDIGMRCVLIAAKTWEYERIGAGQKGEAAPVWCARTLGDAARAIIEADSKN